jgi:hypothetical protein
MEFIVDCILGLPVRMETAIEVVEEAIFEYFNNYQL